MELAVEGTGNEETQAAWIDREGQFKSSGSMIQGGGLQFTVDVVQKGRFAGEGAF